MQNLYETKTLALTASNSLKFSTKIWKTLTKWLHAKKEYKPEYLSEPEVKDAIGETHRILSEPLNNLSIAQEIPAELTAVLDNNIFYFSGFKTHHSLVEASQLLKDEDGNFKPFNRFLKDIATIDNTYNGNYLQAEYNFAEASAQMAVKWQEWKEDGDQYDLQYRTAGDSRVRDEHAALNGTTLPPSDPFWKQYLPPNGWNCRCDVDRVRKGKYPKSNSERAIARGDAMTAPLKKQIFRFNPGAQEKIFPPKHPYYKAPEAVKQTLDKIKNNERLKELKKWALGNLRGEIVEHPELEKIITFSRRGIDEYLNQPLHEFYYEKNELIKDMKNILLNSDYKGVTEYKGKKSHIFEINIDNVPHWIIANENNAGSIIFYSITNGDKVLTDIKKIAN